jgi:hypothetical protein
MATIGRLLARQTGLAIETDANVLKQLALLCCAGLLASVLMVTYGVDLSPGFF